jgi:preprotein translocase subunit SecA
MEEGEPIEHALITRAIENAQSKVEGHNFEIRKQLLEYDDVMNQQREVIYQQRREALNGKSLRPYMEEIIFDKADEIADQFADERSTLKSGISRVRMKLSETVQPSYRFARGYPGWLTGGGPGPIHRDAAMSAYSEREDDIGADDMRSLERYIMLRPWTACGRTICSAWIISKRASDCGAMPSRTPSSSIRRRGFEMFQDMIARIKEETLSILFRIQLAEQDDLEELHKPQEQKLIFSGSEGESPGKKPVKRARKKVGRNAPCPCGSGKKYKKCCGR